MVNPSTRDSSSRYFLVFTRGSIKYMYSISPFLNFVVIVHRGYREDTRGVYHDRLWEENDGHKVTRNKPVTPLYLITDVVLSLDLIQRKSRNLLINLFLQSFILHGKEKKFYYTMCSVIASMVVICTVRYGMIRNVTRPTIELPSWQAITVVWVLIIPSKVTHHRFAVTRSRLIRWIIRHKSALIGISVWLINNFIQLLLCARYYNLISDPLRQTHVAFADAMDRWAFTEEFTARIRERSDVNGKDITVGRDTCAVLDSTYD